MRILNKIARLLILALFVGFAALPGAAQAAVQTQKPAVHKEPVKQGGATPQVLSQQALPAEAPITNVTLNPADVWYTGATVKVDWSWPGHQNSPVDVTLWRGSQQVHLSTGTNHPGGPPETLYLPTSLDPGMYTVRVQSSANPNNRAEKTIRIPQASITVASEGYYERTRPDYVPIRWTYIGNVGQTVTITVALNGPPVFKLDNYPIDANGGNGRGGYFGWKPPLKSGLQFYTVTVTSIQIPSISGSGLIPVEDKIVNWGA